MTDTSQRAIYQVDLSTGEIHTVNYTTSASPTCLDYDPTEQIIYWVDTNLLTNIWTTPLNDDDGSTTPIYRTG